MAGGAAAVFMSEAGMRRHGVSLANAVEVRGAGLHNSALAATPSISAALSIVLHRLFDPVPEKGLVPN